MVALAVLRYRPFVVILCTLSSLAALIWYWGQEKSKLRRAASAISVIAVAAVAFLSRVNIYEIMFKPFDRPSFSSADQAKLDAARRDVSHSSQSSCERCGRYAYGMVAWARRE